LRGDYKLRNTGTTSNFYLWKLIGRVHHSIGLLRQQELRERQILVRQHEILGIILDLGPKATVIEVAKKAERECHVISKQTKIMEKEGLIKRIKKTPRSNLLALELTGKGTAILSVARESKSVETIFSCLSEEEHQQLESLLNKILLHTQKYA
jgi:DNA-binding MarR family transcriptional regulator